MREHQRYPDRFIKTDTVVDPIRLTVKGVETVTFPDGSTGTAASFHEEQRLMALNRTNYRSIRDLAGNDDDGSWDGTEIEIYRTTTTFGSDTAKPCLRIRQPNADGKSAPAEAREASIPF